MAIVFPSTQRLRNLFESVAEPAALDIDLRATSNTSAPLVPYRALGHHLRDDALLSDAQIEQVLIHQQAHGLRFGEAALALSLVTRAQLLRALARQFAFPVLPADQHMLAAELVVAHDPFGLAAERFRALRSQLLANPASVVAGAGRPRRALAVLSPASGDGKSMLAANLAISFSQLGLRTLLVDANLRRPRLHTLFGLSQPVGLGGLLGGRPGAALCSVAGLPSLQLLPAGGLPPNPLELIERPTFTLLLQEWTAQFDQVIVDTPAAEHGADARVLAAKCGAALLVARPGRSALGATQRLVQALRAGPAALLGMVFNQG